MVNDKLAKVRAEIERQIVELTPTKEKIGIVGGMAVKRHLASLLSFIDSMQEEHDEIVDKYLYGKEPELVDDGDLPKEEPASDDFEMALTEMIDKAQKCVVEPWAIAAQWKDYLIELAKTKSEEPVSDDLEEEIKQYLNKEVIVTNEDVVISKHHEFHNFYVENLEEVAHHFANWQKKQLMANAAEVTVHVEAGNYPYIPQIELYDYDKDMPLAKEGEKYKVVLIKEN